MLLLALLLQLPDSLPPKPPPAPPAAWLALIGAYALAGGGVMEWNDRSRARAEPAPFAALRAGLQRTEKPFT